MKRFEDKKYSKTKQTVVILLLVTAMSFTGCGQTESSGTAATPAPTAQAERIDTGFVVTNPDSYDSADTAVLVDINNVDNTVTLLNLDPGLAGIIIKVYDLPQFLRIGQAVDQILSLIGL